MSVRLDDQQGGVLPRSALSVVLFCVFVAVTSFASLNITVHKFPNGFLASAVVAVGLLLVGVVLFTSRSQLLRRVLGSRGLWLGCVLLLTVGDLVRYPVQSRKPNFESAAPALIESGRLLVKGEDPYKAEVGALISAGPGWIVLLLPLTLAGLVMLVNPISAGACAYLISRRTQFGAGVFVLLLLLQPNFVAQSTVGHDLFALPLVFGALCLLAERAAGRVWICLLAIVAAAFATSRLPMIVLLLVLCVGLYRRDRRSGLLFSAIAVPLLLACHLVFYLWTRHDGIFYHPLHLVGRATSTGGGAFTVVGLLGGCCVCAWAAARMGGEARQWMLVGVLFLVAAFVPVAVGELVHSGFWYGGWEGGNYLCFGMSLLVAVLGLSTAEDLGDPRRR